MDALKAEIASKRKALDNAPRPTKYMRKGDIERMKEEEERQTREEAQRKAKEAEAQKAAQPKVRSIPPLQKYSLKDVETSLELRILKAVVLHLWPPRYPASLPLRLRRVVHREARLPQMPVLPSTSQMKRPSAVCVPKANPSGCSANPIRIGVFACARWSSSRKKDTSGWAGRMISGRRWRTSRVLNG